MPPQFQRHEQKAQYRLDLPADQAVIDVGSPDLFGGRCGPALRSTKWRGRCWLNLRAVGLEPDVGLERLTNRGGKHALEIPSVRATGGKRKGEVHRLLAGSLDWDIEWSSLADLPEPNLTGYRYLDHEIEASAGLAWYKQPPLTSEEIDRGSVRPDEVVNSFAVYWPESGRFVNRDGTERVNFETGKFCHVYRPKLVSADGATRWLDQRIVTGPPQLLRVVIDPTDWQWITSLGQKQWPLVLDPTIGYTSIGATKEGGWTAAYVAVSGAYSCAVSATLDSVSYWTNAASIGFTCGVYRDASGPTSIVGVTAAGTSVTQDWATAAFSAPQPTIAAASYWVAFQNAASQTIAYDEVVGACRYKGGQTYSAGSLPTPFPAAPTTYNARISLYATYTEAPTGGPAPHYIRRLHRGGFSRC